MNKDSVVVVFGAGGLIGNKIVEKLREEGYRKTIACTHDMLELTSQVAVEEFFATNSPDYIFFCAVRGITNFESGDIFDAVECYSNIMMLCNVIEAARKFRVKKGIFLGSAMLYPWSDKYQEGRLEEDFLEDFCYTEYRESMRSSVLSKFVGMKMCQYYNLQYGCQYIYAIPTHIYGGFAGRKDLYFLERIVMAISDAERNKVPEIFLDVFGEGRALKQFLHVDDCANALITVMKYYEDAQRPINISTNQPESWKSIVEMVCQITGYQGKINFNTSRKENLSNRLVCVRELEKLGWKQSIPMYEGLTSLCAEYKEMQEERG